MASGARNTSERTTICAAARISQVARMPINMPTTPICASSINPTATPTATNAQRLEQHDRQPELRRIAHLCIEEGGAAVASLEAAAQIAAIHRRQCDFGGCRQPNQEQGNRQD
jgi:hypothetical protein